jgi:glycosyltransferase involved in cell wall biosynthesis
MSLPKVSVILPVFNGNLHLSQAIGSILNQTFKNIELIIIDDGSTDDSLSIIKNYGDSRIVLLEHEKNLGLIAALNNGIDHAQSEYIARMDSDDISLPTRLEMQAHFLDQNPSIGVCGTWLQCFGDSHKKWKNYTLPEHHDAIVVNLIFRNPLAHSTVMMRKALIDQYHLRYDPFYIHSEDYDFWVKFSKFTKLANFPAILLKYRLHQNRISIISQKKMELRKKVLFQIWKNLFQTYGMPYTSDDLETHFLMSYMNQNLNREQIQKIEKWLTRILTMLKQNKKLSSIELEKAVGYMWHKICLSNPIGKNMYHYLFSSDLSKLYKLSLIQKSISLSKAWVKSYAKKIHLLNKLA